MSDAPGAYRESKDLFDRFERLTRRLSGPTLAVVDARVARLHSRLVPALRRAGASVLSLRAGEGAKTVGTLEKVLTSAAALPRSGSLIAVGGGTIGDLATVAAHLIKRGVRLVQVPTTLLAAVDSSLGGKGAVHVTLGGTAVKNAAGVFHYPDETWLCLELFATLSEQQRHEGAVEAWKMFLTLDRTAYERYQRHSPSLLELITRARHIKQRVCARDPYERVGPRRTLNFGHTLGHVIESVTDFGVSHGDAVGLGMLCALDVGRSLGVTPARLAEQVEHTLHQKVRVLGRTRLARALEGVGRARLEGLLAADKKTGAKGELNFVVLEQLGRASVTRVPSEVVHTLARAWRRGERP